MPAGVRMATASASGMEWLTATNSQSKGPMRSRWPSATSSVYGRMRCSWSFASIRASVSLEPMSGMSGFSRSRIRHAADVVLVPVREDDALDVVEAVPDGREVRQDQVDAGLLLLGEEHAAVDDQQPAVVLEDRHVAADLAEAAERDDAQAALRELRRRAELGMRMTQKTLLTTRATYPLRHVARMIIRAVALSVWCGVVGSCECSSRIQL